MAEIFGQIFALCKGLPFNDNVGLFFADKNGFSVVLSDITGIRWFNISELGPAEVISVCGDELEMGSLSGLPGGDTCGEFFADT